MWTLHLRKEDKICIALMIIEASTSLEMWRFFQPYITAVLSTCRMTCFPDRSSGKARKGSRTPMASRVLLLAVSLVPLLSSA